MAGTDSWTPTRFQIDAALDALRIPQSHMVAASGLEETAYLFNHVYCQPRELLALLLVAAEQHRDDPVFKERIASCANVRTLRGQSEMPTDLRLRIARIDHPVASVRRIRVRPWLVAGAAAWACVVAFEHGRVVEVTPIVDLTEIAAPAARFLDVDHTTVRRLRRAVLGDAQGDLMKLAEALDRYRLAPDPNASPDVQLAELLVISAAVAARNAGLTVADRCVLDLADVLDDGTLVGELDLTVVFADGSDLVMQLDSRGSVSFAWQVAVRHTPDGIRIGLEPERDA